MKTLKLASSSRASTGFEPGATAAPTPPSRNYAATLDTAPGEDHFAFVEARRVEMSTEWDAKVSALRARAVDLKKQAVELNQESIKLLTAGNFNGGTEAKARVETLLEEERRILRIELPALEAEADSVRSGGHPTLQNLHLSAVNLTARDREAQRSRIASQAQAASDAFYAHLAEIATPVTLTLAQALVDAFQLAEIKADSTARNLLASKAAA